MPLLERSGRNVRLTPAGEVLVRHANSLLAGVEEAEAELANVAAGTVAGVVRIAAFQSAFLRIVAPALRALSSSHPELRVEAAEVEVEQAAPALLLQQFDVVVGDEYEGQPRPVYADLQRDHLLRERIYVLLPTDHPLASRRNLHLSELTEVEWAVCQPGTGHREMHLRVCRQFGGFEPDLRYTSDDLLILLEMVRTAGAGAMLPELVLGAGHEGVAVRSMADVSVGREVFLLSRRSPTPAVLVVTDALHAAAAALGD